MDLLFYLLSTITIVSTFFVVLSVYPIYALLFLIISFVSIACIFFVLGAVLAGALEVIIYAGAIMVLFIFIVMMLNTNSFILGRRDLIIRYNWNKIVLLCVFLIVFIYVLSGSSENYIINNHYISEEIVTLKSIGLRLFGSYIIVVEIASMLLLAALIISLHLGRFNQYNIKK